MKEIVLGFAASIGGPATTVILSWLVVVLLLAIASAVELPSFGARGWNLAPPFLLGILTVTQPRGWFLAYFAGLAVVASHVLASLVLPKRVAKRAAIASALSCLTLLGGWAALSHLGRAWTYTDVNFGAVLSALGTVGYWVAADGWIRRLVMFRFRPSQTSIGQLLTDILIGFVASGSAVASAMLWHRAGAWATAVSLLPFAVTHRLLASLVMAQRAQNLAIRAIGRLSEAAGLADSNHSPSVEQLSVQLGRMTGIKGHSMSELRRAALLHDIGLVCADQEDMRVWGYSGGDVARWGAEVLKDSPSLSAVAHLISDQAEPFRFPGAGPDPSIDVRSQIINLACELDRLRASGLNIHEVIDVVYSESAFRFMPELVRHVLPAVENADRALQAELESSDG